MNIVKRGNSYRITVSLGTDTNGKRIRETFTYKCIPSLTAKQNEQEAYRQGLAQEEKFKHGGSAVNYKMTFNQFAEDYFKNHAPTLKEYTAVQYKDIYEKRLKPYFGNMRIANITALDVTKWLTDLERSDNRNTNEGKLTANSKGVYFRTLSAMFGVAVRWQIIDDNPCRRVKMPKSKQTGVKALQKSEFEMLLNKIDGYEKPKAVILIYLISLTGIREGEAAGLKWQDIDFENKVIHIEREVVYIPGNKDAQITPPKSANSTRDIFISDLLCDKLRAYKSMQEEDIKKLGDNYKDEGFIITQSNGSPVHASSIRKWIKNACKHCEVPYVTVHGLRHTYASLLIASGMDVRTTASQLGHSSPSLTLNTYANPQNEAKRRAGDLIATIGMGK